MVVLACGDIGQGVEPWNPWGLGPTKFLPNHLHAWNQHGWELLRETIDDTGRDDDDCDEEEGHRIRHRSSWRRVVSDSLWSRSNGHDEYYGNISDDDAAGTSIQSDNIGGYWIKDLYLTTHDREELVRGEMLSDKHIFAAQKLLAEQFEDIAGLQDPCLSQTSFQPVHEDSVQIHHTRGNHWIVSCWNKGDIVEVYDTLYDIAAQDLLRQMEKIYVDAPRDNKGRLLYKICPVQKQEGYRDCGLFAIAIAYELCQGYGVGDVVLKQNLMRQHLYRCFQRHQVDSFPIT